MSLIDDFETDNVKVTRSTEGGEWVKGRFRPGGTEVLQIPTSAQPLTPKEVQLLPEGKRTFRTMNFYTDVELKISSEKLQTQNDVIEYRGENYEIFKVEDWTQTDLPHYLSVGILVDPQPEVDNG